MEGFHGPQKDEPTRKQSDLEDFIQGPTYELSRSMDNHCSGTSSPLMVDIQPWLQLTYCVG